MLHSGSTCAHRKPKAFSKTQTTASHVHLHHWPEQSITPQPQHPAMPKVRPRAHVSHRQKGSRKYAPGVFKAHLLHWAGRRAEQSRQEEGRQASCQAPHACPRDSQAQGSCLLHMPIQAVRHVDVEMLYNIMQNRYKAKVYLNGLTVNETFDFSLQESKDRVRLRIKEPDATSCVPFCEGVLWTTQPCV